MIKYSNTLGGGGGLGIKLYVKQFASLSNLPAKAKENMLAIIVADIAIQDTYLGVELPADPKVGTVFVNTSSVKAGDNTVEISEDPVITAVQINSSQVYDGTKWVEVPARLYKDGKWLNVTDLYLFSFGDQYKDTTGGFEGSKNEKPGSGGQASASYTINETLSLSASAYQPDGYNGQSSADSFIRSKLEINLSHLKCLKVRLAQIRLNRSQYNSNGLLYIMLGATLCVKADDKANPTNGTILTLEIPETSTSAKLSIQCSAYAYQDYSASCSASISEMWGEFR